MKKRSNLIILILFAAIFFIQNVNYGQIPGVLTNEFSWVAWEKKINNLEKVNIVKTIDDDLTKYLHQSNLLDRNLKSFHVVDFDIDGDDDIIFSGAGGTDSKQVILYRLSDGKYTPILNIFGEIINISNPFTGSPLILTIIHYPFDPPDILRNIETYSPVMINDQYEYLVSSKICFIEYTEFPTSFNMKLPFVINNNKYNLRLSPRIDHDTEYFEGRKGNIIAEYSKGAKGIALAERTDDTGRIWWFVMMHNNVMPQNTLFVNTGNNKVPFHSLGWVSSRYLTVDE